MLVNLNRRAVFLQLVRDIRHAGISYFRQLCSVITHRAILNIQLIHLSSTKFPEETEQLSRHLSGCLVILFSVPNKLLLSCDYEFMKAQWKLNYNLYLRG